ncbi:MAG: hypothetical protein E7163_05955 [Firmicutes bacterium]|nr:hypothetical protein [Bacillota bacterium]
MGKAVKDKFKHFVIYLISFCINYLIFILLMLFVNEKNVIGINVVNLVSWIISMLFIFYIDKKYVPDLVDENNSSELFKFVLIRLFSLIIEFMIIYIFIIIFNNNYYLIKLISLILLFIFNEFYVRNFKYK